MLTWKKSLSALALAIAVTPVLAENRDSKPSSSPTANTNTTEATPTAAASPNLNLAATDANVTALLGVVVMKGVLAPSEAKSIQSAAPSAQFQALVEALSRKGLLNAADLSAAAAPPAQPPAPAAPAAVPEAISSSLADSQAAPQQPQTKPQTPFPSRVAGDLPPAPPGVVTAVIPVRVFPNRPAEDRRLGWD
jgi:hypothetical protein